jgi:hypothetical protein
MEQCSVFKRGLDPDFMSKLEPLARHPGWFADVLADTDLVLGIRDNYINIYRRGCSLFKIERGKNGLLKFSTHPKYLIDPDLSNPVPLCLESGGWEFTVKEITHLIRQYEGPKTLGNMKRAAKYYAGGEKKGVHAVICDPENNVIDTEITFDHENEDQQKTTQRIDIACLEEVESSIRLRFWEAKLYGNKEIWRSQNNVVDQVTRYRDKVQERRDEVLESYHVVVGNLVAIAKWCDGHRKLGGLVQEVVEKKRPIVLDKTPFVGLIIFEFDDSQKGNPRLSELAAKLPLIARGDPKGMRLRGLVGATSG